MIDNGRPTTDDRLPETKDSGLQTPDSTTSSTDFLLSLPRFTDAGAAAYRPGFERMQALLAAMGEPHRTFPAVHVAGTNGKGSTASLIAAACTAAGVRTGLHTSPHLVHVTERMRVDGVPAPDAWLADAVTRFRGVMEEVQPSFFEATVALSFLYFAEQNVDLAVVEVGLGGRLDATNVVQPMACAITSLGLEHTDLLGDTIEQIAREKAGILKPGIPVFTTIAQSEARQVVATIAREKAAPWHDVLVEVRIENAAPTPDGWRLDVQTPQHRYDALNIGLAGVHQQTNAALALRVVEQVFENVSVDAVRKGFAAVRHLAGLRGRCEVVRHNPLVVLDVAHNGDGLAAALRSTRARMAAKGNLTVLLGLMRDKEVRPVAEALRDAGAAVWTVDLPGERAHTAVSLAEALREHGIAPQQAGTVAQGAARFYEAAKATDTLLVTGSHQAVALWLQKEDSSGAGTRETSAR